MSKSDQSHFSVPWSSTSSIIHTMPGCPKYYMWTHPAVLGNYWGFIMNLYSMIFSRIWPECYGFVDISLTYRKTNNHGADTSTYFVHELKQKSLKMDLSQASVNKGQSSGFHWRSPVTFTLGTRVCIPFEAKRQKSFLGFSQEGFVPKQPVAHGLELYASALWL